MSDRLPPELPERRDRGEILERNLERLLTRAYVPEEPGEIFQRRLLVMMRERQAKGLGPRMAWTHFAAAAVLLIAVFLAVQMIQVDEVLVRPAPGGHFQLARGNSGWQTVETSITLDRGDTVRTEPGQTVELVWADGSRGEVQPESQVQLADEGTPRLESGAGRWHVSPRETRTLQTPILSVRARDADFEVAVTRPTEGTKSMNPKTLSLSAAGAGALVLVTVVVFQGGSDPVEVTTSDGATTLVDPGQTGTFDSEGTTSVGPTTPESVASKTETDEPETLDPVEPAIEAGMRALRGQVARADGKALSGVTVTFVSEEVDEETNPVARASATTDADGQFELRLPLEAGGRIEARKDRYVTREVPWSPPSDDSETVEGEPATATPDSEVVEITLLHETAIAGRVLRPDGEEWTTPVQIAVQRYYDMYRRDEPEFRTFTAADGSYYFPGIAAGMYRVWAYSPGYSRSAEIKVAPTEHELVEGVDFTLMPGTSLSGLVYDKQTGRPVLGAVVFPPLEHLPGTVNQLERNECDENVRNAGKTGESGGFLLEDLPEGKHLIRVVHPDYKPADQMVTLKLGEVIEIEVAMEEGPAIYGQVIDGAGNPRTQAMVLAFTMSPDPAAAQQSMTTVQEDGSYTIRNLNPGNYIVVLLKDPLSDSAEDAEVTFTQLTTSGDRELNFVAIPELATLRGRIVDEHGDPVEGVLIYCNLMEEGTVGSFKQGASNAEGNFEILNLELGTYIVSLTREHGQSFAAVKTMKFEKPIDYEEELTFHELTLFGELRSAADRTLIPHAEVLIFRFREKDSEQGDWDFAGRAVTDEDAKFRVNGLAPGFYLALGSATGYRRSASERIELHAKLHREEDASIDLKPGASVQVTVIDSKQRPVPGARVLIRSRRGIENQGLPPKTNSLGVYRFDSLTPGPFTAVVELPGTEIKVEQAFTASVEEEAKIVVSLPDEGQ